MTCLPVTIRYENPLATIKGAEKVAMYTDACKKGELAYQAHSAPIALTNVDIDNVEFIGGLWRVQHMPDFTIQRVRDAEFVIGQRVNWREHTQFEYFKACRVSYNCYGPFTLNRNSTIVGYFKTKRGEFWGYGSTIPEVRSFLASQVFDAYLDVIHADMENVPHVR